MKLHDVALLQLDLMVAGADAGAVAGGGHLRVVRVAAVEAGHEVAGGGVE